MLQALDQLEYPERLQKLLLTPNREMVVELVVQKDNGGCGRCLGCRLGTPKLNTKSTAAARHTTMPPVSLCSTRCAERSGARPTGGSGPQRSQPATSVSQRRAARRSPPQKPHVAGH
jgi:hypothetical protein